MKKEAIKNAEGQIMTTQEGVEMYENTLEEGDIIISQEDRVFVKKTPYFDKKDGIQKFFYKYVLKVLHEDKEVYVNLSKGQFKRISETYVKVGTEEKMPNNAVFKCFKATLPSGEEYVSLGLFDKSKIQEE